MPRKTCRCCPKPIGPSPDAKNIELCDTCHDEAGWENEHSDRGHPEYVAACPTCRAEKHDRTTDHATDLAKEQAIKALEELIARATDAKEAIEAGMRPRHAIGGYDFYLITSAADTERKMAVWLTRAEAK